MTRQNYTKIIVAALCGTAGIYSTSAETTSKQPNVIIIITDDQGYGDYGFNGNKYLNTPNTDKLFSESYCFDNFHTGTTSAPTRSGIMTGRYGNTTGVWHTIQGRSIMSLDEYTLAQAFKNNHYVTAMFGKWHLGDNYPYRPEHRGFDLAFMHNGGGVGQTPDYWGNSYFDDVYFRNGIAEKVEGYCTDVWFREAEKFISATKGKPFFCYLSTNAPHFPYNVEEKYAVQYRNNPDIVVPEFYGMISNIDENVGKLRELLVKLGLDKNTVIIYMGDNGSAAGSNINRDGFVMTGYNGGLRGKKSSQYEGGHRQPLIFHIPDKKHQIVDKLTGYIDIMPTLIEMCSLKLPHTVDFDGEDMFKNMSDTTRMLFVDTQRNEFLKKHNKYCVMQGDWRLIDGKELYNIQLDKEQRNNIFTNYPEITKRLSEGYEQWWTRTAVRAEQHQYIPVSTGKKKSHVFLNCHDCHDSLNRKLAYDQTLVRAALKQYPVYWAINVPEDGVYNIELYRWPLESGLDFKAAAPQGKEIPNGKAYLEGVKITNIVSASISFNGKTTTKKVNAEGVKAIRFANVKVKKGDYFFKALIEDSKGEQQGVYYVKFKTLK